jgi:extracellular elastinolytic metalloproteinase
MQMYLWTGAGPTHRLDVAGGMSYGAAGAEFGPPFTTGGITAGLLAAVPNTACTALSGSLAGQIALVDRGGCEFATKALNAQNAGALAVAVANNDAANPDASFTMGAGADAARVTIPALMVSYNAGVALKAALGAGTVNATAAKLAVQPLQIDASLDSDIVYHEVCHGLTWRMIGRMSGPLAGAIGEGMSDVCALMINSDPTAVPVDDVVAEYSASNPGGIRSERYTGHSRSYGSIGVAAGSPQVHFDGEIYAAIIWDLMGRFAADPNIADWRTRLFGYLVDGMNYTPAKPAYEDMRDGILAAVAASGNTADCAKVWDAFAQRGVGVGARGAVRGSRVVITASTTSSTACN